MSSAVAVAVKKIAVYVLGDENKRGKLFVAVGSIIAGFLGAYVPAYCCDLKYWKYEY